MPPLPDVSWAGPEFFLFWNAAGRGKAAVHHRGLRRVCTPNPAGRHFDGGMDSPARRKALADAPSRYLRRGGARRSSLLLAPSRRKPPAGGFLGGGLEFCWFGGFVVGRQEKKEGPRHAEGGALVPG